MRINLEGPDRIDAYEAPQSRELLHYELNLNVLSWWMKQPLNYAIRNAAKTIAEQVVFNHTCGIKLDLE